MKKLFFALSLGAAALFTSCEKQTMPVTQLGATTFTVNVDSDVTSRAAADVDRYVMAIYDADDAVVEQLTNTDGLFNVVLPSNESYTAIFWADVNATDVYDVTDLKAVSLVGDNAAEAWAGSLSFKTNGDESTSVTLGRAVAKLTLVETGVIEAGSTLGVTMTQLSTFNAATMVATGEKAYTNSIALAEGVNATEEAPVTLATDLYILASEEGNSIAIIDFDMYSGEEVVPTTSIQVSNVPVKANSNTNIIGHYTYTVESNLSFSVDLEDTWATDTDVNVNDETDEPVGTDISAFVNGSVGDEVTISEVVVDYVSGSYNYVSDGETTVLVYQSSLGASVGDKVTISGTISTYSGANQLSTASIVETISTGNETIAAKVISVEEYNTNYSNYLNQFISFEDITVSGTTVSDADGNTTTLYNRFSVTMEEGTGSVKGYGNYNSGTQLYVTEFDVEAIPLPDGYYQVTVDYDSFGQVSGTDIPTPYAMDENITMSWSGGTNTAKIYESDYTMRFNNGATVIFSSSTANIEKIEIEGSTNTYFANDNYSNGVWEGSSNEVIFNITGSAKISSFTVTYSVN